MSPKSQTSADGEEVKRALVPKLRFPEFRGAKWVQKKLEDVAPLQRGFDLPSDLIRLGDIPIVYSNGIQKYHEVGMATAPGLVTGRSGTIGKLHFIEHGEYWPHNTTLWVTDFKGNNPRFVYYLYGSIGMSRFSSGSGVPTLNRNDVHAFNAPIPNSTDEQQKIAEFLSSVDELIAAQARKVDALKSYKKGLMQQLFPREGEIQPRLRFPEFQNAGEWEEVSLGDIAEIKLGKMLDKQKNTTGHLLPYLNNLAVRWNKVNTSDLPKMYFNDRELDRFGLKVGDVVVCEGGEPGRAAVWDGRLPDLKFQKAIHRVRFYEPFEPKILVLHLENLAGTTEFEMLFTGGGIKHLTGETFSRLKVPLIPHAEQKRIASCLNNLDALITAETQKHEALKTHKKGLMQQLFPSPEEALP